MTARLRVELFEQIRRAHRLDATVSIRELARRFGTHPSLSYWWLPLWLSNCRVRTERNDVYVYC